MPSLFASDALLPTGWARDVLLEWDDAGLLRRVAPGTSAAGAERAAGPVLPGMPNVHSHAFQRAMAGLAEYRGHATDDFWTWREAMYNLVRRLEPDDVEAIAEHLYIEMLRHGYTTVAEFHYLHHDRGGRAYAPPVSLAERIFAAARSSGIALTLLPVMYTFGGFGGRPLDDAQARFRSEPAMIAAMLEALRTSASRAPHSRLGVAPHSVRAVDRASLQAVVAHARSIDAEMPIHMHLSEQAREVADCARAHGATPFEWIADAVPVDRGWCFIHATHITPSEAKAIAGRGAVLGLCPTTEASLGDGIFDFPAWRALPGRWAVGGDSHVSVSPFEELRQLELSQRLRLRVRNVSASPEAPDVAANLWSGAASGGAQAAGHPAGALEAGRRADFVVLDADAADFEAATAAQALAIATFGPGASRVRDVHVGGTKVVDRGRHAREEAARSAYRASLARLRRP